MAQTMSAGGLIATPAESQDITTTFWMKTTGPSGSDMPFHGRHNADTNATSGYHLYFAGLTGQVNAVSKTGSTFVINMTGLSSVRDGLWHHIMFVYRQANGSVCELYIDGVLDASQTAAQAHGGALRRITFGEVDSLFSGFPAFSGDLAEMAVWSGALVAADAKALAAGMRPDQVRQNTLLYYIPGVRQVYDKRGAALTVSGATPSDVGGTTDDPYFGNVVALLHADGVKDGLTFTDVKGNTWINGTVQSTDTPNTPNARAWTANGNAQLDTSQFKFGTSSLFLDGTGDYVSHLDHVDFEPGTGDFTIECWIRLNSLASAGMAIMSKYVATGSQRAWIMSLNPSGNTFHWTYSTTGGTPTTISGAFTWALNTWYHVAVSRVGTTWRLFVDGNQVQSGTAVGLLSGTAPVYIGAQNSSGSPDNFFNGWIDELRFTKGVGRYSSNFTPATSEFDLISDPHYKNTLSLLHFNGTDASTSIFDNVRRVVTDTAQSLYGGSSLAIPFGCHLQTGDNVNFEFGTGDFTLEAAIRLPFDFDLGIARDIMTKYTATSSQRSFIWDIYSGGIRFGWDPSGSGVGLDNHVSGAVTWLTDTWYQVAVSRVGGVIYLFVDGVLVGSGGNIGNSPIFNGTSVVRIGQQDSGSGSPTGAWHGWIDEVRITKGVGRYVSNYTPPSAPFPDTYSSFHPEHYGSAEDPRFAYVVSLLHFDGADATTAFTDVRGLTWTPAGNAQIDTSQSKFSGSSGLFDGTGDVITTPSTTALNLIHTRAFTLECWARPNNLSGNCTLVYKRAESGENGGYEFQITSTGALVFGASNGASFASVSTGAGLITTGQWYHLAVCCDVGGAIRLYVDGVLQGSGNLTWTTSTFQVKVGMAFAGSGRDYNGWLDDLRITNGVARYLDDFTPPTVAFSNR